MALIKKVRSAQMPLVIELPITWNDTVVNVGGTTVDLSTVATHDFDIMDTPPGFSVLGGDIVIDTAWTQVGADTVTVSLGDSGSATRYASAVNAKSAARTALTITGLKQSGNATLRARLAVGTSAATAGAGRIRVEYVIDGRANENV